MNNQYRLKYHVMPEKGWMNDPNGLIQYKDKYHMFFQHHPYSTEWGPMHWGHVISSDLVHWKYLPIALRPGDSYDRNGCFSGSAVDDDGTFTLIYSGNVDDRSPKQVQCVARSIDGVNFEKYEGNPVVEDVPSDGSDDFRDPKVWKHNGTWYMVTGSSKDGIGKALLFKSVDLNNWEYVGVTAESDGTLGSMWECPDLFPLGERFALIVSPINMKRSKNICLIGNMNYDTGKFTYEYYKDLDYGSNFYAAQTFIDKKGRRIMFAWMNMWDKEMPEKKEGWAGAMTIPRELILRDDGLLITRPIEELESLRGEKASINDADLAPNENLLKDAAGDAVEIEAEFMLDEDCKTQFGFELRCSGDGREKTVVAYNPGKEELVVDKTRSGIIKDGRNVCKMRKMPDNIIKLHIFLDASSVEVFGNDGEVAVSNRIYPSRDSLGMKLFSDGSDIKLKTFNIWKLNSIGLL